MGFASEGVTKLEYASFLAACLAYLSHRQRDRVGIVTFDEDIVTHVPASAKHFNVLLHTLDRAKPERPSRLLPVLDKLAEHFKRRSIVALISDLYENPADIIEALKPYRFLGNDVVVFHILDPAEIAFPYTDASRFQDLESGEELPIVPEVFADQYRQMMKEHIDALTTKCSDVRIDYIQLTTSRPLDEALFTLPRQSRAADAHPVERHVISGASVLLRARGHRGAHHRSSHPARAEERRPFSLVDVSPEDSVPIGGAAPDPQLAAAVAARGRDGAHHRGVHAAVLQGRSAAGGRRPRAARAKC